MDNPKLQPHHLKDLESSGLSADAVDRSGCYSISRRDATVLLGFDLESDGLVFPYPHLNGVNGAPLFSRVKPDRPYKAKGWKKSAKYLTPKGAPNHLYIPPTLDPAILQDPSVPLLISEGEKKALKAVAEGFPCVALPGGAGPPARMTRPASASRSPILTW